MDSRKSRTAVLAMLGLVVELSPNVVAQNETTIPGRQVMVAHYTRHAPVIDGVFSANEWRGAKAVHVEGTTPTTAPGVVPNIGLPFLFPPDSPVWLSRRREKCSCQTGLITSSSKTGTLRPCRPTRGDEGEGYGAFRCLSGAIFIE